MIRIIKFVIICWFILLFLCSGLVAQYYNERANEKSFEQSELFFTSYYLNPFGLLRFKDVSLGLIEDPFLTLHLNPANLPNFGDKTTYFYLDFRGDRTEPEIINVYRTYAYPMYATLDYVAPSYYYNPRWFSNSRQEPEPTFSFGMLSYPYKKLLIGGTYQIIHKKEDYYQIPSWYYNPLYGYDAFGAKAVAEDIPIVDRYSAEDEMINSGHLFSGFMGYQVSNRIDAGISLSGVIQSRDGSYLNSNRDEYGNTDIWESISFNQREKTQDYHHTDLNGGIRYHFNPESFAGLKIGYLAGEADQGFLSVDSSRYEYYTDPENWSNNIYQSITKQNWNHDGNTFYGRISAKHRMPDDNEVQFFYHYAQSDVDLVNSSTVSDTGFYKSNWTYDWDTTYSIHRYYSSLSDVRTATGKREQKVHKTMISFKWKLTPKSTLFAGIHYSRTKFNINTVEPVIADRYSEYIYYNSRYEPDTSRYLQRLEEDKTLHWQYESLNWSIQIPILINFQFNKNWSMMLGINRILDTWEITEQTTAIFERRYRVQDGTTKEETNFGERYTEPTKNQTDDFTDVISSFDVAISEKLNINLLLDPEFKDNFRIAQWWLSFRAKL